MDDVPYRQHHDIQIPIGTKIGKDLYIDLGIGIVINGVTVMG